jgi:hypothetical protein
VLFSTRYDANAAGFGTMMIWAWKHAPRGCTRHAGEALARVNGHTRTSTLVTAFSVRESIQENNVEFGAMRDSSPNKE